MDNLYRMEGIIYNKQIPLFIPNNSCNASGFYTILIIMIYMRTCFGILLLIILVWPRIIEKWVVFATKDFSHSAFNVTCSDTVLQIEILNTVYRYITVKWWLVKCLILVFNSQMQKIALTWKNIASGLDDNRYVLIKSILYLGVSPNAPRPFAFIVTTVISFLLPVKRKSFVFFRPLIFM